jgi:hypothetical protein
VTVAGALRAYYGDADLMRRLLDAPGLDPGWAEAAVSVLGRAARHEAVPQEAVPREAVPQEPATG